MTEQQQATLEADEHGHEWGSDLERVEHGFAPLRDESNPKTRDQREAEAYAELGDSVDEPAAPEGTIESDAERTARVERLRSYPSVPPVPTRTASINGVSVTVPAGPDADLSGVPDEIVELLRREDALRPTGQSKGLGARSYDLTAAEGDPRRGRGDVAAAIKASAEPTDPPTDPNAPPPPPPPPPPEPKEPPFERSRTASKKD